MLLVSSRNSIYRGRVWLIVIRMLQMYVRLLITHLFFFFRNWLLESEWEFSQYSWCCCTVVVAEEEARYWALSIHISAWWKEATCNVPKKVIIWIQPWTEWMGRYETNVQIPYGENIIFVHAYPWPIACHDDDRNNNG